MKSTSLKLLLSFIALTLVVSACSLQISSADADIATPTAGLLITATLPSTFTPRPSSTPLVATGVPAVDAVPGTTTTQINVRSLPSTASEAVGLLGVNAEVEIVGKDAGGFWYQINFVMPDGTAGKGWAAAEYIQTASKPDVPVTSGAASSTEIVTGVSGRLTEAVNVRSGPGTNFDALGLLAINAVVTLTGKNESGTWLQIAYPTAENGSGWVSSAYVASDALDELPVLTESDLATAIPPTPTPEFTPAPQDNDSAEDPAILVTFSTPASRSFSYTSDLSSPEGDAEDWIAFHPNTDDGVRVELLIDLSCQGNGRLIVELWQGGIMLTEWGELNCGDNDYALSMYRDETYQFRMRAKPSRALEYIQYTLTVRAKP
ncbi:MAG: SH3 domain-containing protein [Anaerolineales bacterium]|nr:SH3 domain-containing protein [Anaerolineales bacterium]